MKGPSSHELAEKLHKFLQSPLLNVEHKLFPDGESYLRLENEIKGEDIVIVQGLHPPQDTHLLQLLLMADCIRDFGASSVKAVVPYMAYARQDKRFREGEAISILTLFKLLKAVGVDEVLTINIHAPWIVEQAAIRVRNIDATGLLSTYLLQAGVEKPLVLSPGKKGLEMASTAASIIDTDYGQVESRRDPVTGDVSISTNLDTKDREVVLIDDVISTGQTMIKCIEMLKKMKASRIIVSCIHGLFVGSADKKIMAAGADLIITCDTVPNPYAVASVAGLIASELG